MIFEKCTLIIEIIKVRKNVSTQFSKIICPLFLNVEIYLKIWFTVYSLDLKYTS